MDGNSIVGESPANPAFIVSDPLSITIVAAVSSHMVGSKTKQTETYIISNTGTSELFASVYIHLLMDLTC